MKEADAADTAAEAPTPEQPASSDDREPVTADVGVGRLLTEDVDSADVDSPAGAAARRAAAAAIARRTVDAGTARRHISKGLQSSTNAPVIPAAVAPVAPKPALPSPLPAAAAHTHRADGVAPHAVLKDGSDGLSIASDAGSSPAVVADLKAELWEPQTGGALSPCMFVSHRSAYAPVDVLWDPCHSVNSNNMHYPYKIGNHRAGKQIVA